MQGTFFFFSELVSCPMEIKWTKGNILTTNYAVQNPEKMWIVLSGIYSIFILSNIEINVMDKFIQVTDQASWVVFKFTSFINISLKVWVWYHVFSLPDLKCLWHHLASGVCLSTITKNLILWYSSTNLDQTLLEWTLGGPFPKLCLAKLPAFQNGCGY